MADEYIRRDDVVKECGEWYTEEGPEEGFIGTVSQMLDMFSPTDVAPVRHGKWTHKPDVYGVVYCSECDYELHANSTSFCPNCGAKMDGEE